MVKFVEIGDGKCERNNISGFICKCGFHRFFKPSKMFLRNCGKDNFFATAGWRTKKFFSIFTCTACINNCCTRRRRFANLRRLILWLATGFHSDNATPDGGYDLLTISVRGEPVDPGRGSTLNGNGIIIHGDQSR